MAGISSTNGAGLRARWVGAEGRRLRDEVLKYLMAGRSLSDLGLARIDGRLDLRGFTTVDLGSGTPRRSKGSDFTRADPAVRIVSMGGLRSRHIRSLDFSYAEVPGWELTNTTLEDCVVAHADLRRWSLLGSSLIDVALADVDLRGFACTQDIRGRASRFERVAFDHCRLDRWQPIATELVDVEFVDTNLDGASFANVDMAGVRIAGALHDTEFGGDAGPGDQAVRVRSYPGLDLREADLHDVAFWRVRLKDVPLPDSEAHVVVDHARCVLRLVADDYRDLPPESPERVAESALGWHMRWAVDRLVINLEDLPDADVENRRAIASWLRTLEARCARAPSVALKPPNRKDLADRIRALLDSVDRMTGDDRQAGWLDRDKAMLRDVYEPLEARLADPRPLSPRDVAPTIGRALARRGVRGPLFDSFWETERTAVYLAAQEALDEGDRATG